MILSHHQHSPLHTESTPLVRIYPVYYYIPPTPHVHVWLVALLLFRQY